MRAANTKRIGVASAVAAAMLSVSGIATAAVPGFYFETDVGLDSSDIKQSELDAVLNDVGSGFVTDSSNLDKNNAGTSLTVGYQFTPNIAVEVAYMNLGVADYTASGTLDGGEGASLDVGIDFKSKGPAVSVVGSWAFSEMFSVDARVGAYRGKTKGSVSATDGVTSESAPFDPWTKTSVLFGVGANWTLSEHVGLHLGYTMLQKALADQDVSRISLGLRVMF